MKIADLSESLTLVEQFDEYSCHRGAFGTQMAIEGASHFPQLIGG
jgi:hypothetical protein